MRPIDADAFRKVLLEVIDSPFATQERPLNWEHAYMSALRELDLIPTIDYAPVKHGEWVRQDETYTRFQCSSCKSENHGRRWPFCPICGAKMDGGKNDV